MNYKSSSVISHDRSLSQLVEAACQHWAVRRQAEAVQRNVSPQTVRPFTVALSREVGTQGTLVAKEVGRLLGWSVYDHELLEHIAKEMGLRTALLESVDEKQQSWLRESIGTYLASLASGGKSPWASESAYVHHLVETVLALGIHGQCVIVGRGAALVLPPETTLRVRLVGPVKDRVATLSRTLGVSMREAARQLRTTDRQRSDFVEDHFFKDAADPRNYDLVLNAARLSIASCAALIVETLHRLPAPQHEKNGAGEAS